jgi:hypothetical protein
MKNVFTAGGHDNLSTALVTAAVALVVVGVVVGFHLFMKDRSRAAGAVVVVAFAAAVVAFICSTDAVLVDRDARVDAFVSEVKTSYGLPLTHADGETAYRAYRAGDESFEVTVQGAEYVLGLKEKGDKLVLLVLGGEPASSASSAG